MYHAARATPGERERSGSEFAVGEQALADGHQVGEHVVAAPVRLAAVLAVAPALGLVEADRVVRDVVHPAVVLRPDDTQACNSHRRRPDYAFVSFTCRRGDAAHA